MTEQIARAKPGKPKPNPIAVKANDLDMSNENYGKANFNNLHRGALYLGATHSAGFGMKGQEPFRNLAKQQLQSAQQSTRLSPTLEERDRYSLHSIRDEMSQSPKAIRVTDKRLDFLVKAKNNRN